MTSKRERDTMLVEHGAAGLSRGQAAAWRHGFDENTSSGGSSVLSGTTGGAQDEALALPATDHVSKTGVDTHVDGMRAPMAPTVGDLMIDLPGISVVEANGSQASAQPIDIAGADQLLWPNLDQSGATNDNDATYQVYDYADVAPAQRGRNDESLVIPNLVDFSAPIFYRTSGNQVYSDIGTSRHGGVFVGGLKFSSDAGTSVLSDGSATSSALQNTWIMRINAMHGEMSAVSFTLKSWGTIPVSYYDAAGQLIKTVMVAGNGYAGKLVSFTAPEDQEIAYFTVGSTYHERYAIDDINYTVDGTPTLVDFTNAVYKYADGTIETRGGFGGGAVFLGTLEINSSNTMYQFPRNSAGNNTDANHLALYGWSATTFTLHKQFVYTVSFDAEFRGGDNEIVFYDADNNEIGRIGKDATQGHGNVDIGARAWEHVQFNSSGPAIAYFIVNSGKPGVTWDHRGTAIDNISYPQTEGPVAARSLIGTSDAVLGDDISEMAALSLVQEEQTQASEPESAAPSIGAGGIELVDFSATGDALDLSLGDLLDLGAPDLFGADRGIAQLAAATGDGKELILLADLKQSEPESGKWALFDATSDDALHPVYDHSDMQVALLVGSFSTQTAVLV